MMGALRIKCKDTFFCGICWNWQDLLKYQWKHLKQKPQHQKAVEKHSKNEGRENCSLRGKSYLTKRTIPKLIVEVLNFKQNVRSTWDLMKMLEEKQIRMKNIWMYL